MPNPLYDALLGAQARKSAPLLRLPDGATRSYADIESLAARYAGVMATKGLSPGDRLAFQVAKSPEALALTLACIRAGVILLPLNPAYTPDEVAYFLDDAEPRLVVCDPGQAGAVAPVAGRAGAGHLTLSGDGTGTLAEAAAAAAPAPVADRTEDDLAAFLYTSGTTGRSKGAMLSQGNLLSNARTLARAWRFTAEDVLLHALPIFHTHGLFVACNVAMLTGGTMLWLAKFDADQVMAALPRATAMMGVPTFYTRLLADDRFTREAAGHMRLFTSGSAPLLAETHRAFEARTGHRILERYGMTETGMNTSNPYEGARKAGTVGPPLPGIEVIVTDRDSGKELPPGETGMVEVRGPNVFGGYWRMPEKTAAELRENGFFITGDLGRFDEDGYLVIAGRQKDLVISGGFNVYPKEIEAVIDAQPGVLESAVIGVPHPDFGEAVVAVVVTVPGRGIDPEALLEAVSVSLAGYKRPKRIVTADALPRNAMGKVQKAALREAHAGMFGG